jgi:hypothetical protein
MGGGGGPVPKLYVGNVVIAVNTGEDNDVVITGNLTINAGVTYIVRGKLQIYGNIVNNGTLLSCLGLDCKGKVTTAGSIDVWGKAFVGDDMALSEDTYFADDLICNGDITINIGFVLHVSGNLVADNITNHTDLYVTHNCHVYGFINNTGADTCLINEDLFVGGLLTVDACDVHISGNAKLYQVNVNTGTFWCYHNVELTSMVHHGAGVPFKIDITGDLKCEDWNNTGGGDVNVSGNADMANTFIVTAGCTAHFGGYLKVGVSIANSGTLQCLSLTCGGDVDNTGAVQLVVKGDAHIKGNLTNTTGGVEIDGKTYLGSLDQVDATQNGYLYFFGKCFCDGHFIVNGADASEVDGEFYSYSLSVALAVMDFYNSVKCTSDITISNTAEVSCLSLECGGNVDNTGATSMTVNGDCKIAGNLVNDVCITDASHIDVKGSITNSNRITAMSISCSGDVICAGLGFIWVSGGNLSCYYVSISGAGAEIDVDAGNLIVAHDISVVGTLSVYGNIKTGGNINITGRIVVVGSVDCGDYLHNHTNDLYITGDLTTRYSVVNANGAFFYVFGKLNVYEDFNNTAGGDVEIQGDVHISGYFSTGDTPRVRIRGNVWLGSPTGSYFKNIGTATCEIFGNLYISNDNIVGPGNQRLVNLSTGIINIYGNLEIDGTVLNDAAGTIYVGGNARISEQIQNNNVGGVITILGKTQVGGNITNVGTLSCMILDCGSDVSNAVTGIITANGGILLVGTLTNNGTINNNTYHYP